MSRLVDGEINMFRQVDIGRWRDKYVQIGRYGQMERDICLDRQIQADGERYMFRLVDGDKYVQIGRWRDKYVQIRRYEQMERDICLNWQMER